VITNTATDPRNQAAIAGALATVGRDRPALVVPVLAAVFAHINTNTVQSANPMRQPFFGHFPFPVFDGSVAGARDEIADALASLGNAARAPVPALLLAGQSTTRICAPMPPSPSGK